MYAYIICGIPAAAVALFGLGYLALRESHIRTRQTIADSFKKAGIKG